MKMIELFWISFCLLEFIDIEVTTVEFETSRRVHHLDGFLSTSGYLQQPVVSGNLIIQCGVRCDVRPDCRSYFVDTTTSRCHLHDTILSDVSGMTESTGSCYFRKGSECPDGWSGFENSCYLNTSFTMNFGDAKEFCKSKGAGLPSIESEAENNFIKTIDKSIPESRGPWIGITDIQQQGTWIWEATNDIPSFTDWDDGQPQLNGERCAVMYRTHSYKWHDIGCSTQLTVMCEM